MRYDKIIRRKTKELEEINNIKQENENLKEECEKLRSALNGTMHEVRRLSSEISNHSENFSKLASTLSLEGQLKDLSNTIFFTSGMLASRLAFTDIELNPQAIRLQLRVRSNLYKKFDKARHILLNRAKGKQVYINFKGNSNFEFDAIEAFELVPFVILDNAIKYSPANRNIEVTFTEENRELEVKIRSCGPMVNTNELSRIFEKGFRGTNGTLAGAGEGLGLYLAKTLCGLTSILISANSSPEAEFTLSGIGYSTFELSLRKKL